MVEPINQWGNGYAVQRYASVYRRNLIHQLPETNFLQTNYSAFLLFRPTA